MSGGSLNYFYSDLEEHIGDFGDRELDDLVKDLAQLFHDREWFLSSDTNEGTWREARDAFKAKWFTEAGRQDRIVSYLEEIRKEVLDSLGLNNERCKNCKHWTGKDCYDPEYGSCDFHEHCLMHRSESCRKFKQGETQG